MSQSAHIDSPEVIKEFRNHFIKFGIVARTSLSGVRADAQRTLQWLKYDQVSYWKDELRKRDQALLRAKDEYFLARYGAEAMRKPSYIEEEKAMRRAEARKQEAQHKIEATKKWASLLEQQVEKLMGPVNGLSTMLDVDIPKALARLDIMVQNLEEYLRQPSS
jgi:hypothetical protein